MAHASPYRDGFAVKVSNRRNSKPLCSASVQQHNQLVHVCATTIHCLSADPLSCFPETPAESLPLSTAGAGSSEAEESRLLSDMARQFSAAVMGNTVTSVKSKCPQIHYATTSSIKETVLFPVTARFHLLLCL